MILSPEADIEANYRTLRDIQVDGAQPIAGQSTVDGVMAILNYSDVPTTELARLVDEKLGAGYDVKVDDLFAYFPEKKEYRYGSNRDRRGQPLPDGHPFKGTRIVFGMKRPDSSETPLTEPEANTALSDPMRPMADALEVVLQTLMATGTYPGAPAKNTPSK